MSASIDQVRDEIARRMRPAGDDVWAWVREMFTDRAIVEIEQSGQELQLVEVGWTLTDDGELEDLVLGDPVEVTLEYVAKAEGGPRLAGPIVRKDAAKRIAYSAVLVPGEPDADGEVLTAEKVEEVAHAWLEQFRAFDVQHSVKQVDVAPVESYIEPVDRTVEIDGEDVTLPAGTWTVAAKARDDEVWAEIADGTRTGLSIMGVPHDQMEAALAAVKSGDAPALKRVTLADVGGGDANGDWFAPFIGIVDQPAVPKAKFFALKGANDRSLFARFRAWMAEEHPTPTAGKGSTTTRAGKARDQEIEDMDENDVRELVSESVTGAVKSALDDALAEKLTPITERLDKVDPPAASKDDGGAGDGGDGELSDAVKAAISDAVTEAIAPVAEKADRAEKRSRPGSLQPGDGGEPESALKGTPNRDAFGRRIA